MTDDTPPPPPVPPGTLGPPEPPPPAPPAPPGPQYGQYAPPGGYGAGAYTPPGSSFPWVRDRGIIPLRPLMLSDLFDGAVRAIRFNPGTILRLSFGVLVVAAILQAVIDLAVGYGSSAALSSANSLVGAVISAVNPGSIASIVATEVLTGAVIVVVADAVLGRRTTIAQAWARVRPRIAPLLGFAALTGAIGLGSVLGCLALLDNALGSGASTGTILGLVGLLLLALLALWLGALLLTMTPAVLVLEHQGLVTSMRRSITLIRRQFWRVLGILLLTHLLVGIVVGVISAPLIAIVTAVAVTSGAEPSETLLIGFDAVAGLISGLLTTPFVTAMVSLLYVDCRIRNEGLDVALMRQVQADESGR